MLQAFTIIFCLLFSAAAAAEEELPEIRVTDSTSFESTEDASAFTSVIRPEVFADQMRSSPELLDMSVGVNSTDLGGLGQLSTVSIRGSSAEQVAVFVDGVRLNSAQGGGVDMSTIPLENIERIEVIRGGGSAKFGTDAIGGVINIVTKRGAEKGTGEIRFTGGSFTTFRSNLSWAEPLKKGDLLAAHTHFSSHGNYPFLSASTNLAGTTVGGGREFTREQNRSLSENFLLKGSMHLSEATKLILSNDFSWSDREIPGVEEETTLLAPANPLEATNEIFRNTTAVRLIWKPLEFGITNLFTHDRFQDPSPAIGSPIDATFINDSISTYTSWSHHLTLQEATIRSLMRSQYRFDYARNTGTHERHTGALFGETELGLFEERVTIAPSLRLEKASDRNVRVAWKVGTLLQPHDALDFKANLFTSHRYPSFNELYFPDQGYLRGNPNLDDERSFGGDIGVVLRPKRAAVEVSLFQQQIENSILFVPVSATTIQPINTLRVESQGIEITAMWNPLDAIDMTTNYTWLDARFATTGERLPTRPRHKLNARLQGKYRAWKSFGEVQYVGGYPVNTANTVFLSDRTTLNTGLTLRFGDRLFATFEVKNLTNVQIYDARGFPLPRRSFWVTIGAST